MRLSVAQSHQPGYRMLFNTICGAALPFKELSRQYTPCAWALVPDAPEVLYIEDLTKDARSADLPPYPCLLCALERPSI